MIQRITLLLLASIISACVTTPQPSPQAIPRGVYKHMVSIQFLDKPSQSFLSVTRFDQQGLHWVVLTPFGTTLLRIRDKPSENHTVVVSYAEELKPYIDQIAAAFRSFRPAILDTSIDSLNLWGHHITIFHEEIDGRGIPHKTKINGKNFELLATLNAYENSSNP